MKLLRLFLVSLMLVVLSACDTNPIIKVTGTQTVKVEVPVYCKFDNVTKPEMPFDEKAAPGMDLFEKSKLLAAQDKNLKGYTVELEGALSGCKAPAEKSK